MFSGRNEKRIQAEIIPLDPMNHVLSLLQAARTSPAPNRGLYSHQMLSELLALHEDMILQLHLERREAVEAADFLTGLIGQHESAAAMLRAHLETHGANTTTNDHAVVRHAGSTAEKASATGLAQDIHGVKPVGSRTTLPR